MISKALNPPGKFDTWTPARIDELKHGEISTEVGARLVYQDASIKVWQISLKPGERLPFHKHTTDYNWVALTPGKAVSHYGCGKVVEITYQQGDVYYYHHSEKGDFTHDLENIGPDELSFGTVEYWFYPRCGRIE